MFCCLPVYSPLKTSHSRSRRNSDIFATHVMYFNNKLSGQSGKTPHYSDGIRNKYTSLCYLLFIHTLCHSGYFRCGYNAACVGFSKYLSLAPDVPVGGRLCLVWYGPHGHFHVFIACFAQPVVSNLEWTQNWEIDMEMYTSRLWRPTRVLMRRKEPHMIISITWVDAGTSHLHPIKSASISIYITSSIIYLQLM